MAVFIVEHLDKKYGGKRGASDVSFSIEENEIFGMVGPNGAGKTTIIECSLGIRKRDSGNVDILGNDPALDRNKVFGHVGIKLQETSYPDKARVREICALISSLYAKPLPYTQLLKDFELEDKKGAYISDLSGEQRQRLAIILALLPDPKIVVFDELTTGLDSLVEIVKVIDENNLTLKNLVVKTPTLEAVPLTHGIKLFKMVSRGLDMSRAYIHIIVLAGVTLAGAVISLITFRW